MGTVEDPVVLWAWTVRHLERLIEELHFHQVRTCSLAIHVAWTSGDSTGGASQVAVPTDRFDDLLDAARVALRRAYVPNGVATHLHVIAPELRRARRFQLSLFEAPVAHGEHLPVSAHPPRQSVGGVPSLARSTTNSGQSSSP